MAIDAVLVGARGTSTGSSVSTTGGSVTTGDTLVAVISYDPGATISSVADTAGNTYTLAANNTGGSGRLALYYCQNATGNASNVLTVNFSAAAFPTAHLIKVTGAAAASYDGASLVSSSASQTPPWTSTSNALAQAASCVIACTEGNANGSNGAYSVSGGSFSLLSSEPDATQFWTSGVAKSVVASTSAVTATWSKTGEGSTVARGSIIVAFKEATGGSASTGSSATTLGTVTQSAAGTVTQPPRTQLSRRYPLAVPNRVEGQVKRRVSIGSLRADPQEGTGATLVSAEAFGAATSASTGTSATTLGSVTQSASGKLAISGTSATTLGAVTQSAVGSSAPNIGHALALHKINNGGSSLTTAAFTTQATGSVMLVSVGRGILSDFGSATVTDNQSNSYTLIDGSHAYTNWSTSGTALYADLTAAGGSGHTVTTSKPSVNDEVTVVAVEVPGVNTIVDSNWSQNATTVSGVSPTTTTSGTVTTTGAAKLVAFWWGDNVNGEDNPAASAGWSRLDFSNDTTSNHVQAASFYREVSSAGSYSITVTPNIPQGAQVYILALQQVAGGSGTSATTLDAVTQSAAGKLAIAGTSATTLGAVTQAAAGALAISGTSATTLGAVTQSAAGALAITGTSATTLDAVTQSAAGNSTAGGQGTSATTLDAITQAATGVLAISGTSATTLGAVTQAASGALAITGSSATTLGALTQSAAGALAISGSSATTLGAVTQAASGSLITGGIGTSDTTLGAVMMAATATLTGEGNVSQALGGGGSWRAFSYSYERELARRQAEKDRERREREAAEDAEATAALTVAPEVPRGTPEQPTSGLSLDFLRSLVASAEADAAAQIESDRVARAFALAQQKRTDGALLALDRELMRLREEEEFAVLMALAMDD